MVTHWKSLAASASPSVVYNLTDKSALWVPNEHYDEKGATYRFDLNG